MMFGAMLSNTFKDCFKLISSYMTDYDRESENRCSLAKNIIKRGWTDVDFANEIYAIIIKQVKCKSQLNLINIFFRREIIQVEKSLSLVLSCLLFVFSFLSREYSFNNLFEIGSNRISLTWIQCFIPVIYLIILGQT